MHRSLKKRSRKAGMPPGTALHIGEPRTEPVRMRLLAYDAARLEERAIEGPAECLADRRPGAVLWLDIVGVHDAPRLAAIGESFGLHPLVVEDLVNTDQRPKVEDYGAYLFIVLTGLSEHPTRPEVLGEQVSLVLGKDFVLSFQEGPSRLFEPVCARLRANRGRLRAEGPDQLLHALLDSVVDEYFGVLERLGERIELLEGELITRPSPAALQSLHRLKREMVFLRRALWPLREVIATLERDGSALIGSGLRPYLRDVHDHAVHAIETVETYREMLSGMLELYLSSQSNRLNETMKVLTVMATIFIPLSFIAGIYGMNFRHMPGLDWVWGYPLVLLVMLAVAGGMLLFFRRRRWL